MLEGQDQTAHDLLLCAHTVCMNYVRSLNISIGQFLIPVFCARSRPEKRTKTYNKELYKFFLIPFLSINHSHQNFALKVNDCMFPDSEFQPPDQY